MFVYRSRRYQLHGKSKIVIVTGKLEKAKQINLKKKINRKKIALLLTNLSNFLFFRDEPWRIVLYNRKSSIQQEKGISIDCASTRMSFTSRLHRTPNYFLCFRAVMKRCTYSFELRKCVQLSLISIQYLLGILICCFVLKWFFDY